jgi:DNA invertase Pin-like site-specific DNA recombinase
MGWKLNKDNGIWWKDGIKTSDGVFINIKKRKHKKRLIFDKYPELVRTEKKKEMFDEMVTMRNEGLSYNEIGNKIGVSSTTVFKWLNNEKY